MISGLEREVVELWKVRVGSRKLHLSLPGFFFENLVEKLSLFSDLLGRLLFSEHLCMWITLLALILFVVV